MLGLIALSFAQAPARAPEEFISTQTGTLPIILSAPHGGAVRIPGSEDRKTGVTVMDVNTAEVLLIASQRLNANLGGKPYFVIAQFSRRDADANRNEAEGVESDAARGPYRAYHEALRRAVDDCRKKFGVAILIDFHGQAREKDAIVRGTLDGASLKRMRDKYGDAGVIGENSIFGKLKAAGYRVIPDPKASEGIGDETFFEGGFITQNYGAHNANGVDAIQLEMGEARHKSPFQLGRDVADAITATYKAFVEPDIKKD